MDTATAEMMRDAMARMEKSMSRSIGPLNLPRA